MKHTIEELLLAATVRPLAHALRESALQAQKQSLGLQMQPENLPDDAYLPGNEAMLREADSKRDGQKARIRAFETQWREEHPLREFVAPALKQLEDVADIIQGH